MHLEMHRAPKYDFIRWIIFSTWTLVIEFRDMLRRYLETISPSFSSKKFPLSILVNATGYKIMKEGCKSYTCAGIMHHLLVARRGRYFLTLFALFTVFIGYIASVLSWSRLFFWHQRSRFRHALTDNVKLVVHKSDIVYSLCKSYLSSVNQGDCKKNRFLSRE